MLGLVWLLGRCFIWFGYSGDALSGLDTRETLGLIWHPRVVSEVVWWQFSKHCLVSITRETLSDLTHSGDAVSRWHHSGDVIRPWPGYPNIRCVAPFLPLCDHFYIWRSLGKYDLIAPDLFPLYLASVRNLIEGRNNICEQKKTCQYVASLFVFLCWKKTNAVQCHPLTVNNGSQSKKCHKWRCGRSNDMIIITLMSTDSPDDIL